METNREEIRASNRKALPKLILFLAGCLALGAVLGVFAGIFLLSGDEAERTAMLQELGTAFSLSVCPWLQGITLCLQAGTGLLVLNRGKQLLAAWDGEDEEQYQKIGSCLNAGLLCNTIFLILAMFFFGARYSCGLNAIMEFPSSLVGALVFVATGFLSMALQGKTVDLARQLAPEKKVSYYDLKFQKQWYQQCDEAERAQIGFCSRKAYLAMGKCCMALWLGFVVSGLLLNTGILPVLAVCIVWLTGSVVYSREASRFEQGLGGLTP